MEQSKAVYPLFYSYLEQMELLLNKQISITNRDKKTTLFCFDLLGQVESLKAVLEKNLVVTNVNFQEIVRKNYLRDKEIEAVRLDILIKEKECYQKIAFQKIPLFKFKKQKNEK